MADLQNSAAEVSRALRDRTYESEPDKRRREIAEANARRPAARARSRRFAGYRQSSSISSEAEQGDRDIEAQTRAKKKARR